MNPTDIALRRMHVQRLEGRPFRAPEEMVRGLLAVQSQDYGPAKWSIGQRVRGATDASVEQAFNAGAILRTHALRPTWHFVAPADLRWLQALTAPRVHAQNAYIYRQTGLEDGLRERARRLLTDMLRGGNHLTRPEVEAVLLRGGITATGQGLAYVLMDAELECVVCSGAMKGKQHTYALVDERVPDARVLPRDEALEELVVRYFTSHGPATAKDLRWWSTLPLAEIREGIERAGARLRHEEHGGVPYWSGADAPARAPRTPSPAVHLLQGYDEYFVGYSESRGVIGGAWRQTSPAESTAYLGTVVLDTQLVGRWKRAVKKDTVVFDVVLAAALDDAQARALEAAADRFGAFLGLTARVEAAVS